MSTGAGSGSGGVTALVSSLTTSGSSTFIPASLSHFFIFSPKNVPEGKEYEKIMWFYPDSVPVETQTKYVGLNQAFVGFTGRFSPDRPSEAVHYEKHTSAIYSPEPEIWMVLMVSNPSITKVRDGKSVLEYKENELDDIALHTALRQSYSMFKLFHGTFLSIQEKEGEAVMKAAMKKFFSQYVPMMDFDRIDLFSTLDGIHFLPVDKNVYLRIQCFINLAENTFSKIHYSCYLHRDHLVWSGLEQDDMRILYRYIVNYLIPSLHDNKNPFIPINHRVNRGFITGPKADSKEPFTVPTVFVGSTNECYKLVMYQTSESMCIFLVENDEDADAAFFENLGSFIYQQVEFLAPILEDHYMKKQGVEEQYKYIYFNHMNFALKTSLREKGGEIPRETMKMLNDIHADFERSPENISEELVRTQNDRWVVGRKSEQREFYVIFDQKNSHLIEITEEVKKLCSTYFNNIFID